MALPLSARADHNHIQAGLLTLPPFQQPSHPAFSPNSGTQWLKGFSFYNKKDRITAAGRSRIFTEFPFKPIKGT